MAGRRVSQLFHDKFVKSDWKYFFKFFLKIVVEPAIQKGVNTGRAHANHVANGEDYPVALVLEQEQFEIGNNINNIQR